MTDYKPEDYAQYRLQRAKETIQEVKILIENKFWNTAINRMYYACFYAVGSLLVKNGVENVKSFRNQTKIWTIICQNRKS